MPLDERAALFDDGHTGVRDLALDGQVSVTASELAPLGVVGAGVGDHRGYEREAQQQRSNDGDAVDHLLAFHLIPNSSAHTFAMRPSA